MFGKWTERWYSLFDRANESSTFIRRTLDHRRSNETRLCLERLEDRTLLSADPLGPQFLVSPTLGVPEHSAPVAVLDKAGDFVTAWQSLQDNGSYAVYVQAFTPTGTAIGNAQIVSTGVGNGNQMNPSIASDGNDNFVVTWQGEDLTNFGDNIYYQEGSVNVASNALTFDLTTPSIVNTLFTTSQVDALGDQTNPSVAMDANDNFVIAWQSKDLTDLTLGSDIYARQGTIGKGLGKEFLVTSTATGTRQGGDQTAATVAMSQAGGNSDFLIAWQGPTPAVEGTEGEVGSLGVFAKLYSSDGSNSSGEFQVSVGTHDQIAPAAAMNDATNGQLVIAWQGEGTQGSGSDIFAQRYTFITTNNTPAVSASGSQFQVNQTTAEPQRAPSVGMDQNGDFLVTWQSSHQDGYSWGVYGQAYDANGAVTTSEFLVNNVIQQGPQTTPAVSTLPDGQTVVTWYGPQVNGSGEAGSGGHPLGVHARVFNLGTTGATPPTNSANEFLLSLVTSPEDQPPATATDANGDYVVVWQSWEDTGDMSGFAIYAQRFDATGKPIDATPILVNTTVAGSQSRPAVAMDAAGDFVVVWQNQDPDGVETGISGRYFNAKTGQWGQEFSIVTDSVHTPTNPSVAMDKNGNFVVVWQSYGQETTPAGESPSWGIFGESFVIDGSNASGVSPSGSIFQVNTFTNLDQVSPTIAMNAAGQFVVAWVSDHNVVNDATDTEKSIFARTFNSDATAITTTEFLVNTYVKDAQESPAVALNAQGNIVVVWQSINQATGTGVSWDVYARQFNLEGQSPQTEEFQVNQTTSGPQRFASVGMDGAGNFVVAWQSMKQDGSSWAVFDRQFNNTATALTDETQVNTWTKGPQILPAIAEGSNGNFGIFWSGQGQGPDGSPVDGVIGRAYAVALALAPAILPSATAGFSPGDFYTFTFQASGGSGVYNYTISGGSLPNGLSLNTSTGVLSGTPTQSGSFSFTVRVGDVTYPSLQAATQTYSLQVVMGVPTANSFIESVYEHLFGRTADPDGLAHWTNLLNALGNTEGGRSLVVADIEGSAENRFVVVNHLYEQYLHRSANGDPGAMIWVNLLGNGWAIEQVAALIVTSPEFIQNQTDGSFSGWLNALYEDAFQRPVDANGLATWSVLFAGGASAQMIAMNIFQSAEYSSELVDSYYTQFLNRSSGGDPGSLGWVSLLQQGVRDQTVIAQIIGSQEFYNQSA